MKISKKLLIAGILAWVLLALMLFITFMDSRPAIFQVYSSSTNTSGKAFFHSTGTEQQHQAGRSWRSRSVHENQDLANDHNVDWLLYSSSWYVIQNLWKGVASPRMLSSRLQMAMNKYMVLNRYKVWRNDKRLEKQNREELHCQLKKQLRVLTLDGKEPPFSKLGWEKLVPQQPLDQLDGAPFKTCAAVTSAGAILRSRLGQEINDHDLVLRFNGAPTEDFEDDVGEKTTIRIINSQILSSPTHNFWTNNLYKDIVLVAWDPPPYNLDLEQWYQKPDYDLFIPYKQYRTLHPTQPFYILHPKFIWQLWDIIQRNTMEDIQPNPPSSGFIGIILMMALCEKVDVYEFIPSERQSALCHYYEQYRDDACTLGAYHPLLYEKMLIQRMNIGSEAGLKKGKATLPGFSAMDCGS